MAVREGGGKCSLCPPPWIRVCSNLNDIYLFIYVPVRKPLSGNRLRRCFITGLRFGLDVITYFVLIILFNNNNIHRPTTDKKQQKVNKYIITLSDCRKTLRLGWREGKNN